MQQKSWCRLCGDRDETINHIINECSKLPQKEYQTKYDWVWKELFKNFNLTIRTNGMCTTQNPPEKILWDFEIQTDHLISARQPDLVKINKKRRFWTLPADHRVKLKESKKRDKHRDLAREVTEIPIVIAAHGKSSNDWHKLWSSWK